MLEEAKESLNFLEDEYMFVKRCTDERDLLAIVEELKEEGFKFDFGLKNGPKKKEKEKEKIIFTV